MAKRKHIVAYAGYTSKDVHDGRCAIADDYETIGRAVKMAKRYLTVEFQNLIEASELMNVSAVYVDGECHSEFTRKGYKEDE